MPTHTMWALRSRYMYYTKTRSRAIRLCSVILPAGLAYHPLRQLSLSCHRCAAVAAVIMLVHAPPPHVRPQSSSSLLTFGWAARVFLVLGWVATLLLCLFVLGWVATLLPRLFVLAWVRFVNVGPHWLYHACRPCGRPSSPSPSQSVSQSISHQCLPPVIINSRQLPAHSFDCCLGFL